jgi:N,N'-diacetyllegionaminate synthase
MLADLHIGERRIGAGHPCYVIAEAGSNHNGSYEQALALIDVAVEAGCDAVKFQVFSADQLYAPEAGRSDYLGDERSIYDIIKAMELPAEWLPKLADYCKLKGIEFLCSAFDEAAVDLVDPYVVAWKNASYELTHLPLLKHMLSKGKPVLASTGTATLDEVGEVMGHLRRMMGPGPLPLVLLQCTASYPAPLTSAHAKVVTTLREAFGVWTGLSDHTGEAAAAAVAAVAQGAVIVEKHYTLSRRLPGPDHRFALEPHQLAEMVRAIRQTEAALGSGAKIVDPVEHELRHFARRSVFVTRDLPAGHLLEAGDLRVLRRGKLPAGLEPYTAPLLPGRRLERAVAAFAPLQAADLADSADLQADPLTLRRAAPDDALQVWEWNNEPAVRALSLATAAIPWIDHLRWFAAKLADPHCRLWIAELAGEPVGVVRIDAERHRGVVSLALGAQHRGQGLGRRLLKLAGERYCGETGHRHVDAVILGDNLASQKAFAAAGYVQTAERELQGRRTTEWRWQDPTLPS